MAGRIHSYGTYNLFHSNIEQRVLKVFHHKGVFCVFSVLNRTIMHMAVFKVGSTC